MTGPNKDLISSSSFPIFILLTKKLIWPLLPLLSIFPLVTSTEQSNKSSAVEILEIVLRPNYICEKSPLGTKKLYKIIVTKLL